MIPQPPPTAPTATVLSAEAGWQRLHPLSPVVRIGPVLSIVIVLFANRASQQPHQGNGFATAYPIVVGAIVLAGGVISWIVTRWRIEDGVLRIESGLVRRSSRRFPPDQLQAVDTVKPLIARIFGLAEVRVRMAAATGSAARLAYLREADADALRARLLALAHGVAEHTPEPPERPLVRVDTGRLIGSILVSGPMLLLGAVVAILVVTAALAPSSAPGVLAGLVGPIFAAVTMAWRYFNGHYGQTVAEAPDGLRVRTGLLQTASETIPYRRVQAARLVQPLVWRPLGWCRLQIEVAGKQRSRRENSSVSMTQRTLLPVGTMEEAFWLLSRIMPDIPPPGERPPLRARLKSPLRYHYLTWNRDAVYAVATSGRIRRVTDWVPLAKVQSVRLVEGPVQRRLHLATVHLDTAGRNIHVAARDRDASECSRIMDELPRACRAARLPAR